MLAWSRTVALLACAGFATKHGRFFGGWLRGGWQASATLPALCAGLTISSLRFNDGCGFACICGVGCA